MPTYQSRSTAVRGEIVRLYCRFIRDGQMVDPLAQPMVRIVDSGYYQESSSSSSSSPGTAAAGSSSSSSSSSYYPDTGFGPFPATRETTGVWFIDWFVPDSIGLGDYYDIWTFQWDAYSGVEEMTFGFTVYNKESFLNWVSPPVAIKIDEVTAGLMNDLQNIFIFEAQHIPVYWEQGYNSGDRQTWNFAYGNWNQDPKPIIRINKRVMADGFFANYNGLIKTGWPLDPEDEIYAQYYFKYFSDEEILDFLNAGLYAMNSVPPASTYYSTIEGIPFEWKYGVILGAAIQALKRLVFGFNFIERAFVLSAGIDNEAGSEQQRKIDNFKSLYTEYQEVWNEQAKNVKTRKLPGIMQVVIPEYTLPGGRSRWYRYLYKTILIIFVPAALVGSLVSAAVLA